MWLVQVISWLLCCPKHSPAQYLSSTKLSKSAQSPPWAAWQHSYWYFSYPREVIGGKDDHNLYHAFVGDGLDDRRGWDANGRRFQRIAKYLIHSICHAKRTRSNVILLYFLFYHPMNSFQGSTQEIRSDTRGINKLTRPRVGKRAMPDLEDDIQI